MLPKSTPSLATQARDAGPPRLRRLFVIDASHDAVDVVVRNGLLGATFTSLVMFATLLLCLVPTFAPGGVSHPFGITINVEGGPPPFIFRVIMVAVDLALVFALIGAMRNAIVPERLTCRQGKLVSIRPTTFRSAIAEFRWEQIQELYGGDDRDSEGKSYYLGIVDQSGKEHRLLLGRIDRKEALELGRLMRPIIGLPPCDQDAPDFDRRRED